MEACMKIRFQVKWLVAISFFLITSAFVTNGGPEAQPQGMVGTQTCIGCHQNWLDNNPSIEDTIPGNAHMDYLPLNLFTLRSRGPFYTIPEGYVSSSHYTPASDTTKRDFVTCEGCHGGGSNHYGKGPIPNSIPDAKICGNCHKPPSFEIQKFLLTRHSNQNDKPGKFFDQGSNGKMQATTQKGEFSLFKSNRSSMVTQNERIEECSVCHNYALEYPQFTKKIAQGNIPKPQVSCGACHDAHIPKPNGNQPLTVSSTVKVTQLSGTAVTAATPVDGRKVSYRNFKPYKIDASGAQDTLHGVWTRGSAITRSNLTILRGIGTLSNHEGISDRLTFSQGGFLGKVRPHQTVFISGQASTTVKLPSDAVDAGSEITVRATLDRAGFEVEKVIDDRTLDIKVNVTGGGTHFFDDIPSLPQLGSDKIGVVAKATVTYKKTAGGTGNLPVFIPLTGSYTFEVRDMRTNLENLCGSCHTQGKLKYTEWGKKKNDGSWMEVSQTHNQNILGQYRKSGHANIEAEAFELHSASKYGSYQHIYPIDMSITGTGGENSLRNGGNTHLQLTQTPNPENAYLVAPKNMTRALLPNNYNSGYECNQCHHGLGSIDYQMDRQGTDKAQVLWGDATVTCLTCHDPHQDKNSTGKNVRIPVKISYNSLFVDPAKNPRGGISGFMDGTDLPANIGDSIICIFCHQGRESGFTIYTKIKEKVDPYTKPDQVIDPARGFGFISANPHYLEGAAILWSRNAWEFFFDSLPQRYSTGNPDHQKLNCIGCHMSKASADNNEGGHTWKPNLETCRTCHGSSLKNFFSVPASADYDGDGVAKTAYEEIGTINPNTGLLGQLNAALISKGIIYNPGRFPYFYTEGGALYSAFTSNTLAAAYNLAYAYRTRNAVYVHNTKYIVQILQDSLRALGVTPKGVRPQGDRPATDYRKTVVNP